MKCHVLFVSVYFMIPQTVKNKDLLAPLLPLIVKCYSPDENCIIHDSKVELPNPSTYMATIFCCPAESNNQSSLNLLVIETVIGKGKPTDGKPICNDPVKPSVYRDDSDPVEIYQIGYAILKDEQFHWPPTMVDRNNFIWISEMKVKYDLQWRIPLQSIHHIYPENHSNQEDTCENYELGYEYTNYTEKKYNNFYTTRSQDKIFKHLPRPTYKTSRNIDWPLSSLLTGDDELVPHPLIPMGDFIIDRLKQSTCTYLNRIPLWESIAAESVKRVQDRIREVVDFLGQLSQNSIEVITLQDGRTTDRFGKTIYLDDSTELIPIPTVFIKVLGYRDSPDVTPAYIAVVIHNEHVPQASTLCAVNRCSEYGWNVESVEGGLTYCCAPNDEIFSKALARMPDMYIPRHHQPFDLYRFIPTPEFLQDKRPKNDVGPRSFPAFVVAYNGEKEPYKLIHSAQLLHERKAYTYSVLLIYCPAENFDQTITSAMSKTNLLFNRAVVDVSGMSSLNWRCQYPYRPAVWRDEQMLDKYFLGYLIHQHTDELQNRRLPDLPHEDHPQYRSLGKFWIQFDTKKVRATKSEHVISAPTYSNAPVEECPAHMTLGIEKFPGMDTEAFQRVYHPKSQKNILKRYTYDESEHFVAKELVPIEDFRGSELGLATCTHLNRFPVWRSVANGPLLRVENYLRKVADHASIGKLYVHTALCNKLTLPVKSNHGSGSSENVYLNLDDDAKRVQIPENIVKIVGHRVEFPPKPGQGEGAPRYKYYFMVIVVQNNFSKDFSFKCRDINFCTSKGWRAELPFGAIDYELLDLTKVPTRIDDNGKAVISENVAEYINKKV